MGKIEKDEQGQTNLNTNPDDEKSFLIFEPEKPGNKGKYVIALLPERRFYLKFISIQ